MTPTPEQSNPFGLTPDQRQVFGEYIFRQKNKGRTDLPMSELEIVIDVIKIALTAAARVGGKNATIERCAQVAEKALYFYSADAETIAAAIRALKDKT